MIDISDLGTVLGVWAHPDDETFLTAGLMALARAAGHRVVCATATRGEHGTADPDRWPPARLGRLREYELAAALAALDVHEHTWLGFVDGGCAAVPPALGARAAVRPGDEITAEAEVVAVRTDKPITELAVSVTTGAGVRALEGRAVCYTIALPDARAR
jgi:LmbE family N-acetylglucosaminyl deacetylase